MFRHMLKSKIHRATVTEADLNYEGSISIDRDLLAAANILDHEKVLVVNLANGARLETYAIPAPAGSGTIGLNGGAAHHGKPGDLVLIITFATYAEEELKNFSPQVVLVDSQNKIKKANHKESFSTPSSR